MKMKPIITSALAMLMTVAVMAQKPTQEEREARRAKMEIAKIGFLTQELNLTTKEAQQFWPVYNKYKEERHNLMGDPHKKEEGKKKIDEMSDSEVKALIEKRFSKKEEVLAVDKKYYAEFQKVLPIKKVAKLYKAEHKFKRQMLQRFKQKKGGKGKPQGKGSNK